MERSVHEPTDDWIELTATGLSTDAAMRHVTCPEAGGIAVFLGTTRAETSPEGHALAALNYEAYPQMAIAQMRDLAARSRARWPIIKLALLHRTGRVAVAEASVLIAVACAHRGAAFEASRWLIETLKAEVTVWKKEVWADGSVSWVEGTPVVP